MSDGSKQLLVILFMLAWVVCPSLSSPRLSI